VAVVTDSAERGHLFVIGDPGRAALELPAGPPPARIGPADVELSTVSMPGLVIRAASSRGLQHRAGRKVRQDAFALGHRAIAGEDDQAVAVVCDGLGSLDRSDEAAVLVSRRLAECGAAGQSWPDAFASVNEELRKAAEYAAIPGPEGHSVVTMATTAVAVSVRGDDDGWTGAVAWVGDSPLWHLEDGGKWTLIAGPEEEDEDSVYYSGRVRPLPSQDGACEWTDFRLDGGSLFLMSDGVGNPLKWSRQVRETLAAWWASPPDPFDFAAQVAFARKGHMDDRTVVGIWAMGTGDASPEAESRTADPAR
jgi:serine/threonine protein phosphatase PrpC